MEQVADQKYLENNSYGRADSFRYTVLSLVVDEEYQLAIKEVHAFVGLKDIYPEFRAKVAPYVKHCEDLVRAIKAKRNFPGRGAVPSIKLQEIDLIVRHHFDQLVFDLKKIESILLDQQVKDARSTVWVLKAFSYSLWAIAATGFFLELSHGLLWSLGYIGQERFQFVLGKLVSHLY